MSHLDTVAFRKTRKASLFVRRGIPGILKESKIPKPNISNSFNTCLSSMCTKIGMTWGRLQGECRGDSQIPKASHSKMHN